MARQRSPTPELGETSKPCSSQVKETGSKHLPKAPQSTSSKPIATKAEVTKNVSTGKINTLSRFSHANVNDCSHIPPYLL